MKIKELFETSKHYDVTDMLEYWRQKKLISNNSYKVNDDGSVDLLNDQFNIVNDMLNEDGTFPFKINSAKRLFIMAGNLSSFKNFPEKLIPNGKQIGYSLKFRFFDFVHLTSFEHCPSYIDGTVDFTRIPNISYRNIHKYIDTMTNGCYINPNYKGPLLGFMKVKELKWIDCSDRQKNNPTDLNRACDIISNHLIDRDILACQEELMEAGLNQFAKL